MYCFSFQHPQAIDGEFSDRAEQVNEGPTAEHCAKPPPSDRVEGARDDACCSCYEQPDRRVDGTDGPNDRKPRRQPINEEQGARKDEPGSHEPIRDPARSVASEPTMRLLAEGHRCHERKERPGRVLQPQQYSQY